MSDAKFIAELNDSIKLLEKHTGDMTLNLSSGVINFRGEGGETLRKELLRLFYNNLTEAVKQ